MADYSVFIKRSAAKELESLPRTDPGRIVSLIEGLSNDPRPSGCARLSGQERYRIRQGDYRIVYSVDDDERVVLAVKISHRGRSAHGVSMRRGRESYDGLPGAELVEEGIRDLTAGRESIAALLVSIGAPRLGRCGVPVEHPIPSPEHRLYRLLQISDPDSAHSRYNALVRRLVSFERALECAG